MTFDSAPWVPRGGGFTVEGGVVGDSSGFVRLFVFGHCGCGDVVLWLVGLEM